MIRNWAEPILVNIGNRITVAWNSIPKPNSGEDWFLVFVLIPGFLLIILAIIAGVL